MIDNKGTINTVRNNQVTTSNVQPINPLKNDVWFDNTDTNNSITKIWDGNVWRAIGIESKTLILNRDDGNFPTATNNFFNLPLSTIHIQFIIPRII
ncbi:hypothetical protein ACSIGC_08020 [Tenacibaculum sp. ZS6-P6]|uniref:hypothetical protein n=1 Tax=Tenacibaculum sp. ZS6-P6 TaxID=3447503 RepID=UPI003F988A42